MPPTTLAPLLVLFAVGVGFSDPTGSAGKESPTSAYIEFLWQRPEAGSGIRQHAKALVMSEDNKHLLCWKSPNFPTGKVAVRVEAYDAVGELVAVDEYEEVDRRARVSVVTCRPAMVTAGTPGAWTFKLYFDGELSASSSIHVFRNLSEMDLDVTKPYVIGRISFPKDIEPHEWNGRLTYRVLVNEFGLVTQLTLIESVGIGKKVEHLGSAAAMLTRFPPDPSRVGSPMEAKFPYTFASD